MILFLEKPTFATSPTRLPLALLKYQFIIINSMQTMYTVGNINITDSRNPNMITENDIDFEHVLDMQRRNLSDPDLEELR